MFLDFGPSGRVLVYQKLLFLILETPRYYKKQKQTRTSPTLLYLNIMKMWVPRLSKFWIRYFWNFEIFSQHIDTPQWHTHNPPLCTLGRGIKQLSGKMGKETAPDPNIFKTRTWENILYPSFPPQNFSVSSPFFWKVDRNERKFWYPKNPDC